MKHIRSMQSAEKMGKTWDTRETWNHCINYHCFIPRIPDNPANIFANLCSLSLFVIKSDYVIKRFFFCSQSGPFSKNCTEHTDKLIFMLNKPERLIKKLYFFPAAGKQDYFFSAAIIISNSNADIGGKKRQMLNKLNRIWLKGSYIGLFV